jgi:hypothetical protein
MDKNQIWNQVIMCSVIAAATTSYLIYSWRKRTVWFPTVMRVVSQAESPDLFRAGIAYLMIFDGIVFFFLFLRAYELFKSAT